MKSQDDVLVSNEEVRTLPADAEAKLRQAARILANGAIRAAMKRRQEQAQDTTERVQMTLADKQSAMSENHTSSDTGEQMAPDRATAAGDK